MESAFMQKPEEWFAIAQDDLVSAKLLNTVPLTTLLFHVQQCAEKSLKAFIAYKKLKFNKTHDLVNLVDTCMEADPSFETLRLFAAVLTPYEIDGRYPNSSFIKPNQNELNNLIDQSAYVYAFVYNKVAPTRKKNL